MALAFKIRKVNDDKRELGITGSTSEIKIIIKRLIENRNSIHYESKQNLSVTDLELLMLAKDINNLFSSFEKKNSATDENKSDQTNDNINTGEVQTETTAEEKNNNAKRPERSQMGKDCDKLTAFHKDIFGF